MSESVLVRLAMEKDQEVFKLRERVGTLYSKVRQLEATNRTLRSVQRPTKHQLRDLKRNARDEKAKVETLLAITEAPDYETLVGWVRGAKSTLEQIKEEFGLGDTATFGQLIEQVESLTKEATPSPKDNRFPIGTFVRVNDTYNQPELTGRVGQVTGYLPNSAWPYEVYGPWNPDTEGGRLRGLYTEDELTLWHPQVGDRVRVKQGEQFMLDDYVGRTGKIVAEARQQSSVLRYDWRVDINGDKNLHSTDELEPHIA